MTVTRTHFTFRIDLWTPDGESIVEHTLAVLRLMTNSNLVGSSTVIDRLPATGREEGANPIRGR
jgi:hypothetical protein